MLCRRHKRRLTICVCRRLQDSQTDMRIPYFEVLPLPERRCDAVLLHSKLADLQGLYVRFKTPG